MALLELRGLTKSFGGLTALDRLDLKIDNGEILGLVGPNGSGKTTCLNVITGFLAPTAGNILYKGESIVGLKPHQIAKRGIARTSQLTSTFFSLTTKENVILGRYLKANGSFLGSFFQSRSYREEEKRLSRQADEILTFLEMEDTASAVASEIPSVDQRKLEVAIALAGEPDLLLLDEPAAGMNPEEQDRAMSTIRSLQKSGLTLVIVEHNMKVIMGLCTRIVVLNYGNKIAEGTPEEISSNEEVISVYLGRRNVNA
jgi:branched-chain amino acid transport system ATP-binding protein